MFEKDPNLTTADIVTHLQGHVRAAPPPASTNDYGAGLVDAEEAHNAVP
jgi:hypothetical protein